MPVKITGGDSGTRYDSGITTLTTSLTVLTSNTTHVYAVFCANTTGTAATVTITDNQGSAKTYYSAVSLAANSVSLMHVPVGLTFLNGIKWNAGTSSAINCQIIGSQP